MKFEHSEIYVFSNHFDAENAVRSLGKFGFDLSNLSIIGKGQQEGAHPIGFYAHGEHMHAWGEFGIFWGAIWGLLVGPAMFVLPGVGILAMAGPVVTALVNALEGAVVGGGIAALAGALVDLGIRKRQLLKFEAALQAGSYLLIVHGSAEDIERAHNLLEGSIKRYAYENLLPSTLIK